MAKIASFIEEMEEKMATKETINGPVHTKERARMRDIMVEKMASHAHSCQQHSHTHTRTHIHSPHFLFNRLISISNDGVACHCRCCCCCLSSFRLKSAFLFMCCRYFRYFLLLFFHCCCRCMYTWIAY